MPALYLVLGTFFGFVLSRSGAADYNFIQGMFLFERFQLYGIIGSAVVLTAPGLWLIQRRGRTVRGAPVQVELKPMTRGTIVGSVLFGAGWALAGACPGPIVAQVGMGRLSSLFTLAGLFLGITLADALARRASSERVLSPCAGETAEKLA